MSKPKPFLFLDDAMTLHGIKFDINGGRWERFTKNPIMLYMHVRGNVIGKWNNLRIADGGWWGDPEFDMADEAVKPIAGKVERGFLNACSIGAAIHAAELIDGQIVATDWEPYECSIVDAGSNPNALQLYTVDGEMVKDPEAYIKNLTLSIMSQTTKPAGETVTSTIEVYPKGVIAAFGLPENAATEEVTKAVTKMIARNISLEAQVKKNEATRATDMVEAAFAAHKISDSDKTHYLRLAAVDFDTTKAILDGIEAPRNLASFAASGKAGTTTGENKKADSEEYDKLFKEGSLLTLKIENPARYKQLFKAHFGSEPEED